MDWPADDFDDAAHEADRVLTLAAGQSVRKSDLAEQSRATIARARDERILGPVWAG